MKSSLHLAVASLQGFLMGVAKVNSLVGLAAMAAVGAAIYYFYSRGGEDRRAIMGRLVEYAGITILAWSLASTFSPM